MIKISGFSTLQNLFIKKIHALLVWAGFWEWDAMFFFPYLPGFSCIDSVSVFSQKKVVGYLTCV